jgi:hypothetical protein
MKIVMTLLVRDEQDIVRENIEYHLSRGVDFIIATDNRSEDETPSILKEYEKKGVLHYIFEGEDNYNQHEWVTRMARMAYVDYAADWIINNDADEFWWPVDGSLKETLGAVEPEFNIVRAKRYDFVVVGDFYSPFYHTMVYREKSSLNSLGKPLHPKVAHRGFADIIVNQGTHSVAGIGDLKAKNDVIDILHYPIRNYEHLLNKVVKGGQAYDRNRDLPKTMGATWRELYKEYQTNGDIYDYYHRKRYSKERLSDGIESGAIVHDDRLSVYFEKHLPMI